MSSQTKPSPTPQEARSPDADAPMTGRIVPRVSWPRPATPTTLTPAWAGEFVSFEDWVNFARQRLSGTYDPLMGNEVGSVCIDSFGRRCTLGGHFARARDEGAFPVRFFWDCCPDPDVRSEATITGNSGMNP